MPGSFSGDASPILIESKLLDRRVLPEQFQ